MNTADRQSVVLTPRSGGGVHHLPATQHFVGAVDVVPLMVPVPDGSLCDICQHGLTHNPSGPVDDGVAEAVWSEELSPAVGVDRVDVIHHTPGEVEAAEAVRLEGGSDARALNINSRTQVLQCVISGKSEHHQITFGQNKLRGITSSVGPLNGQPG